jgi:mannose-6-phosphate isomerase-like protein (cupin superfamily)
VKLQSGTQDPIALSPGDCIHQPALAQRNEVELSEGCELLELAVPLQPMLGSLPFDLETQQRAATPVLTHDRPESYKQGDGPRKYFQYRDLGIAEATGGRIHIHIIRATGPAQPGGTGWHRHTMCQLFYIFTGSAVLEVEPHDAVRMHAGDAMCISAGTRHNVPDFSSDYSLLEVCSPADYDTVDSDAPGAR